MITDQELDQFRLEGTQIRVVRDLDPVNDVLGIVVAWNDKQVMVRKRNRKLVKLDRAYLYEPATVERKDDPFN